jgi:hypothetical protein
MIVYQHDNGSQSLGIITRYTTNATNTPDTLAKLSQCDIDQGINSKNATNSQNRGTATIMRQTTRRSYHFNGSVSSCLGGIGCIYFLIGIIQKAS